ncbi:methyltransferase [Nocardia sp. 348MFTsu5.1]|uniref:methyltransferase n=1 Tax=Nocardia sp. 348MFTsu5.1 TaxID=1172185 RepID=UPI000364BADA|nr:methyltransferase [Nocardia sp. 348MFTsu5.1]
MTTTQNVQAGPEQILKIASGFMAAKHLFAANELGLFEALADSPADIGALAARTGLTVRTARISADAMVALEVLERDGDTYRNGPAAATFLSGRTPADLRPFLRFWDKISYRTWTTLAEALGTGRPPKEIFELDDEHQAIASAGIEAVLAGPAAALPNVVDLSTARRLLDIGGGTGSWSIAAVRACPTLQATVLDLPVVAEIARGRVADAGLNDRIKVVVGDATSEDLPSGHDVVLVANLIHYWSPAENLAFLARVRRAVAPGARLVLADFWTDPTHTSPVHAALMAGEFAVHMNNGDVYSVDEVREWLGATDWRFAEHLTLAGPQSLILATADQ